MKLKVKVENQTFDVEILDIQARPILAKVDGDTFEVYPEESDSREVTPSVGQLSSSASAAPAAVPITQTGGGGGLVTAPIPGTIVAIGIKVGDEVVIGQELCALEAMKMKNAIRATRPGKIKAIHISVGDQVKHGQPLCEFAE